MNLNIYIYRLNTLVLIVLMLLASLNLSKGVLANLGYLFQGGAIGFAMLFACIHIFSKLKVKKDVTWIIIAGLGFSCWYFSAVLFSYNCFRGVKHALQAFFVVAFSIGAYYINWNSRAICTIGKIIAVFIVTNLLFWLISGLPREFSSYTAQKNHLSEITYLLLYFPLLSYCTTKRNVRKYFWFVVLCLGAALLYATSSRASWLALGVTLLINYLMRKKMFKHKFAVVIMPVCLFGAFIFTYIYATMLEWYPASKDLNQLVYLYTGGNLFSGREEFWGDLVGLVSASPVWGYGASALPRDFINTSYSSHNLYLQTSLQTGLIGLLLICFILWVYWFQLFKKRDCPAAQLSAAYLIGVVFYQALEVSLTQNNLSRGLWAWVIFSIGLKYAKNESKSKGIEKVGYEKNNILSAI